MKKLTGPRAAIFAVCKRGFHADKKALDVVRAAISVQNRVSVIASSSVALTEMAALMDDLVQAGLMTTPFSSILSYYHLSSLSEPDEVTEALFMGWFTAIRAVPISDDGCPLIEWRSSLVAGFEEQLAARLMQ